jgi:hypothetical protein
VKITPPLKWQEIPFAPKYQVSWVGYVKNDRGSILLPDVDRRGRRRYTIMVDGKPRKFLASRLVLLAFIGPCPDGMEACHNNGDCTDDRLDNLRWDTPVNNKADMVRHGTRLRGELINTAKLTVDNVLEIRRVGYPLRQHAEKFNVTEALVCAILKRKVWKHV